MSEGGKLKEGARPRFTFDLQVDVCTRWELECTQTHTMSEVESLGAKHIAHPTSVQSVVFLENDAFGKRHSKCL